MEQNWYQSNETEHIPAEQPTRGGSYSPPPLRTRAKRRRGLKIITVSLSVLVLLLATAFLFTKDKGETYSLPAGLFREFLYNGPFARFLPPAAESAPPEDNADGVSPEEIPDDFKEYFSEYYSGYTEAEDCNIPLAGDGPGATMELLPAKGAQLSFQQVYTQCVPTIVAITAFVDDSGEGYYWGTGIVMSADGYILTNAHVIAGTSRAKVTMWDDSEYDALLVGIDNRSDIAVLKIDARGLTAAKFGDSDSLRVGDSVIAIGNPLGEQFRSTMTEGIVSGIDRDISYNGTTLTLIQTSAPINEGNSGGPLINLYGQVIGITNMKMSNTYTGSVSIEGVGFAIPTRVAKSIAEALIADGAVLGRPALGITVGSIPETAATQYSLPDGLYISAVSKGSDCEAKGLQTGDIVTAVNGKPAMSTADITSVIAELSVGDTLTLTIFREGNTFDVTVALVDVNDVY